VQYLETRPSADLAADVHCFWELDGVGDALHAPFFPDGRVEIGVHGGARPRRHGASSAQPDVMVVGQMTTAVRLQQTAGMHAIGIRFTPTGARKWRSTPLVECTDRIYGVDQVDSRMAAAIRDAGGCFYADTIVEEVKETGEVVEITTAAGHRVVASHAVVASRG
jgi:hypothetical protein